MRIMVLWIGQCRYLVDYIVVIKDDYFEDDVVVQKML